MQEEIKVKTYTIKAETADKLRAAAPALGMKPSHQREIVGPGMEALHLAPFAAVEFDLLRKAAKVSADVMIGRILKGLAV
ncbi:hypothetical protein RCEXPLORER_82 [Rhodobacter phage RcExplorer]|nr:hypothetical protein RCEXPLORER_82 [Rhodobacter phage RcExplorer]